MSYSYQNYGNFFGQFGTATRSRYSGLGASGATKWYWGQHAKVCNAMNNGDLRQAIIDAAWLSDLGIQGKNYAQVIESPELLKTFRDSFVSFRGKMLSYTDSTIQRGMALIDGALAKIEKPKQMQAELDKLKQELEALRKKGQASSTKAQTIVKVIEQKGGGDSDVVKAVKQAERAEKVAKEGGEVKGSGGKTVKESLAPGRRQTRFMRSTNKPGANLHPDHWKNLAKRAPANFDEQKYLAKHPDVAKAVKMQAMPSGLWHYVKYGKTEGRALAGLRRPGFLAGIFANWNQRG